MAHYPMAIWEPTKAINWGPGPMAKPPYGLLLHITDGAWVDKLDKDNKVIRDKNNKIVQEKVLGEIKFMTSTFDSRHISTHFAIAKNGSVWQFVDTDQSARALGGSNRDTKWISVENFALPGQLLTGPQLASVANLYAWLIKTTGMSMNIVDVTKPAAAFDWGKEQGLGGHSMFKDNPYRTECPGLGILGQRSIIMSMVAGMVILKGAPASHPDSKY